MTDEHLDVAVVGCGPVGATFTALLAQRGLRVAAFEREADVYHLPRAAHFDGEVMRVFQGLGVAEAVLPATAPIGGMHFHNGDGEKLFGFDAPPGPGPMGWAANYMFYQPDLERALRAHLARQSSATVHLEHAITAITHEKGSVTLAVSDRRTGASRMVSADYVVGCDGARSLTRAAIGSALDDYKFDQPWLVVDALSPEPDGLPDVAVQYCDPARPATFVPQGEERRRWEVMLLEGETAADVERPERVHELLAPFVDVDRIEIIRAVVYTFHALVAEHWRRDRILLMGDAAHQMPPFLGQGMCAGIRDAANLAWKLDLVLHERAPESLLDTYQTEREPHVRTIVQTAVDLGGIIQTTDPEVAAGRDAHFRTKGGEPMGAPPAPPLGPGLVADGGGEPIPQPGRLDDTLGTGFAVVVADRALIDAAAATQRSWDRIGITVHAAPGLDGWLRDRRAFAAVVRPDRYVFGLARGRGDLDTLTTVLTTHGL